MIERLKVCAALIVISTAASANEAPWVTVQSGPITIKTRELAGSPIHEILAEADLDAAPSSVVRAVSDVDRFSKFMPYVKESRVVGKPAADGSRLVYTSLALPFIAGRDFVITDRTVQALNADGGGEFVSQWQVSTQLPERQHFVRLKTNTGSWRVSSRGGKTHVVYQFAVDPGGALPGWISDIGNRTGVPGVLRAVEKEAQRLGSER